MVMSMTAFARSEARGPWGGLAWELRSVNHRYLELSIRLPEELRGLEPRVRELVGQRVGRGKVECSLRYHPEQASEPHLSINEALARQLAHASREIDGLLYNPAPVSSIEVLKWPGVLLSSRVDGEQLAAEAEQLLVAALDELMASRQREGAALRQLILQRCEAMQQIIQDLRIRLPQVMTSFRERLQTRLQEIKDQLDPTRLEQELLIFAQKADIDEELDRFETHLKEVTRVCAKGGSCGRRLDFLMQELNREANTTGSKSSDAETTRMAVELKVLIEQAREQVQNIE